MAHSSVQSADNKPQCNPPILENIPPSMKTEARWVLWRFEWRGKSWTKTPIDARSGFHASTTDRATWSTFADAVAGFQRGGVDGVGFVLGDGWAGIDLDDHIFGDGKLTPFAEHVLQRFGSYQEVSPSGEGIKLFVRATIERGCADHANGIEVYGAGRFFTVTGRLLSDRTAEIENRQTELVQLLNELKPPRQETILPAWRDLADRDKALATLDQLSPSRADGYHEWLAVGMALHSFDSSLLDVWDRWSAQSTKRDEQCCPKTWNRFGRSGYTLASLVYWADQDSPGWRDRYRKTEATASPISTNAPAVDMTSLPVDDPDEWPAPLGEKAFIGLGGEFVQAVLPHTEADAAALLFHFLAFCSTMFGRERFFTVGGTEHHTRLFVCFVGQSSKARKGTAFDVVDAFFRLIQDRKQLVDSELGAFCEANVTKGLVSGEGLVFNVRDGGITDKQPDPGVPDKRLLIVESEFGSTLRIVRRRESSLVPVRKFISCLSVCVKLGWLWLQNDLLCHSGARQSTIATHFRS